jgi:predicted transcriptional regulator
MYRAFLSYAQMKEYLAMLTANDLLSYDTSGIYRTTDKGLRFLDATRKMDGMVGLNTEEIPVKPRK